MVLLYNCKDSYRSRILTYPADASLSYIRMPSPVSGNCLLHVFLIYCYDSSFDIQISIRSLILFLIIYGINIY